MEAQNQPAAGPVRNVVDARRRPRFRIEVPISIHSKTCGRIEGHTVDISESGIAAILKLEVPLGELVELDFSLPFGRVMILAMVRQRNAFRYGFQFAEAAAHDAIRSTCRHLAVQTTLLGER